jgi:hypothetical protein
MKQSTSKIALFTLLAGANLLQFSTVLTLPVHAANDKITICHAAGQNGTTHFETLEISENAVYGRNGNAGHFSENGTPQAGHENDYMGACRTEEATPTPTATPESTPESSATPAPTAAPATNGTTNSANSNTGSVLGEAATTSSNAPVGQVLGDYAATGTVEDAIVNSLGLVGNLLTTIGAVLYAKKRSLA